MRIVKKKKRFFILLAMIIGFNVAGCKSHFTNNKLFVYSSIGDIDISFSLNEMSYLMGDEFGPIKNCSSKKYPKCLIFDSTVIILPKMDIINGIEGSYYEGRNEELDLNYTITKSEVTVLGKKIKGYMFYVAHPHEMMNSEVILGKLKGAYFYSMSHGILFYEHNSEIILSGQKKDRLSVINWSTKKCGFFANDCENK